MRFLLLSLAFIGGCSEPTVKGPPVSSDELIAKAVADGKLSAETGIVYRVFAVFGDQRLPAAYRGDFTFEGTGLMADVRAGLDGFSQATQDTLAPFLLPPSADGSWIALASAQGAKTASVGIDSTRSALTIEWTKVTAVGGKVTIWSENRYPGEDALAQMIASGLDNVIWKKLFTEAGMKEPAADDMLESNGGDKSLDIYLVHLAPPPDHPTAKVGGLTTAYYSFCSGSPSFIEINTLVAVPTLLPTVAHELLHASQFTYAQKGLCSEYRWWAEATATWAEDFTYPNINSEREYVLPFLTSRESLDYFAEHDLHPYGAYLFPFMVTHQNADPKFISRSWQEATTMNSLDAVNAALGGDGIKKAWADFAKLSWNQDSVTEYQKWDGLKETPNVHREIDIVDRLDQHPLKTTVDRLTMDYSRVSVKNASIRTITLDNIFSGDIVKGGHVWLVPKIAGVWKDPEELGEKKVYCRDKADENLDEMILIVSNSEYQTPNYVLPDDGIRLSASVTGCTGYTGTIDYSVKMTTPDGPIDLEYTMQVGFQHDDAQSMQGMDVFSLTSLHWTYQGSIIATGICRTNESAAGDFKGGPMGMADFGSFVVYDFGSGAQYVWTVGFGGGAMSTQVSNCNDGNMDVTTQVPFNGIYPSVTTPQSLEADGSAIGTLSQANGTTTNWNLVRIK
jgi:hypothetical protein